MKKTLLLLTTLTFFISLANGQSISSEIIKFQFVKPPQISIEENSRKYKITVTSPYNLKAEDIFAQSKSNYEKALKDYDNVVLESEKAYHNKLEEYEIEEKRAKEKYEIESAEFNKLSLLERMALIDQGKKPALVLPAKPIYYKPSPPIYKEPDLNDYIIIDNSILATQIEIAGFKRGTPYLDINIDIQPVNFQDNAGQTYVNQSTKLIVKLNGEETVNTVFFQDYEFISSSPSNNIDKTSEEKRNLDKIIDFLNRYLNDLYGYPAIEKNVKIQSVKNKKNLYDDLERADIYVATNLRKLQGGRRFKSKRNCVCQHEKRNRYLGRNVKKS